MEQEAGVTTSVYMPISLKARAEAEARSQDRSLSWVMCQALEQYLVKSERNGHPMQNADSPQP
jgi:predicted transcriptional regulator